MKKIILVIALAACTAKQNNAASELKKAMEKDAKCSALFTGEGSNKMHAAVCVLPNKAIELCSIDSTMTYQCRTIREPPPTPTPPIPPIMAPH